LEIRDKSGAQNLVANHMSRTEGSIDDASPIRDEFPDESLLTLSTSSSPWFANIVNYLPASIFPSLASKAQCDKLRAMLGITFGMTPICGKCAVIRLPGDAFQTMRLTRSSNFVIHLHLVVTLAHRAQLVRC